MPTVSIIYFSGSGHTAALAASIRQGAAAHGAQTHLLAISGEDIVKGRYQNDEVMATLDASDAIIFGSPTYMGGPAAQFKAFADATNARWQGQQWRDKVAAGFSVSGALSGDKFSTLQYFHTLAMQHGMVWVGLGELPGQPDGVNRLGGWGGAMAQVGPGTPAEDQNSGDALTGERLGQRVVKIARGFEGRPEAGNKPEAEHKDETA